MPRGSSREEARLPVSGGVFEAVGETFRTLGRLGGPPSRYLARDTKQLSLDIGLKSTR